MTVQMASRWCMGPCLGRRSTSSVRSVPSECLPRRPSSPPLFSEQRQVDAVGQQNNKKSLAAAPCCPARDGRCLSRFAIAVAILSTTLLILSFAVVGPTSLAASSLPEADAP